MRIQEADVGHDRRSMEYRNKTMLMQTALY
jgi:hypothetical protein